MAELRRLFPGGGRRRKHHAPFLVFPTIAACKRQNARPRRKCAVPGTSWRSCFELVASNHRPLIALGPYKALVSR
jgi:hypothetical protein